MHRHFKWSGEVDLEPSIHSLRGSLGSLPVGRSRPPLWKLRRSLRNHVDFLIYWQSFRLYKEGNWDRRTIQSSSFHELARRVRMPGKSSQNSMQKIWDFFHQLPKGKMPGSLGRVKYAPRQPLSPALRPEIWLTLWTLLRGGKIFNLWEESCRYRYTALITTLVMRNVSSVSAVNFFESAN